MKKSEQIRLGTAVKQAYANIIREREQRRAALCALFVLCFLFAAGTVRLMTLRGLSLENIPKCGEEQHKHTEECMGLVLDCDLEERPAAYAFTCGVSAHHHGPACYNAEGKLVCGKSEQLIHTHHQYCYTSEGELICCLAELEEHKHSDSCYEDRLRLACGLEEEQGHTHSSECFRTVPQTLSCGIEESAGHVHGEGCYAEGDYYIACGMSEGEGGHVHGDACYAYVRSELTCGRAESDGHSHSSGCYEAVLACGMEEGEEHQHSDSCRETRKICGMSEGEGAHSHGDACYAYQREIRCGMSEGEGAHAHSADCYEQGPAKLVCGMNEGEGAHTHDENCYTPEHLEPICGQNEAEGHSHDASCYAHDYVLTCQKLEWHEHTDACHLDGDSQKALVCGIPELPAHDHGADCLEMIDAGHRHKDECYKEERVCGKKFHIHEARCYLTEDDEYFYMPTDEPEQPENANPEQPENNVNPEEPENNAIPEQPENNANPEEPEDANPEEPEEDEEFNEEDAFICGLEEHLHDEDCYDENENLICGIEEHSHIFDCLSPEWIAAYWGEDAGTYDNQASLTAAEKNSAQDLAPYIKNGSADKNVIKDGETGIKFTLEFEIPSGGFVTKSKPVLSYMLPAGIKINEKITSPLRNKQTNETIGYLEIATDGKAYLKFFDSYLTNDIEQNGFEADFWFEAGVDIADDKEQDQILFPGNSAPIIVKGNGIYHDYTLSKSAGKIQSDGSIEYTITVNTTVGTVNNLELKDVLSATNSSANYDQGSVQVKKNGQQLNGCSVSFGQENSKPTMNITGISQLQKDDVLTITYKVNNATLTGGDSGGVDNEVKGKAQDVPQEKSDRTNTPLLSHKMNAKKSGNFDQQNRQIEWTIEIRSIGKDMFGYEVTDTMTPIPETVTIQNNQDWQFVPTTLPYTFLDHTDTEKEIIYTIRYKTEIPQNITLTPDNQTPVSNSAEIKKGEDKTPVSATVQVQGMPPSVGKDGVLQGDKIVWTITVRRNDGDLSSAELSDVMNGADIPAEKVYIEGQEFSFPIKFSDVHQKIAPRDEYVFTYTTDAPPTPGAGESVTVNNRATLDDKKGHTSFSDKGVVINGPSVEKVSWLDNSGRIGWKITVKRGNATFEPGTELRDELVPDGTPATVYIQTTNNVETYNFPIQLDTLPVQDQYEFVFYTDVPEPKPGEQKVSVTNKAIFVFKEKEYPAESTIEVTLRPEELKKIYNNYVQQDDYKAGTSTIIRPQWLITSVPPSRTLTEYVITDEIHDLDGFPDSHYALFSNICYDLEIKVTSPEEGEKTLCEWNRKDDFYYGSEKVGFEITFYDKDKNVVARSLDDIKNGVNGTTQIKSFKLRLFPKVAADAEPTEEPPEFRLDKVTIKYLTSADLNGVQGPWEFKNSVTAGPNNLTSEASHKGKVKGPSDRDLIKVGWLPSDAYGNGGYKKNGDIEYDLDMLGKDRLLKYRIIVDFANDENGEIVLTDTLPMGTTFVDTGFWYGYYESNASVEGRNKWEDIKVKATPYYDNATRKLTIKIDGGYNPDHNLAHWICIEYCVKLADWLDPTAKVRPLSNSVVWEGTDLTDNITVKLKSETPDGGSNKSAWIVQDSLGFPLDEVEYTVVINEAGLDLNPKGDKITLTDQISFGQGQEASASLLTKDTKLYDYDPNTRDHKGNLIPPERYNFQYNPSNNTIKLVVPDNMPCVLVYRYEINRDTAKDISISNNILFGTASSSSHSMSMKHNNAGGGADGLGKLTINKIDADHNSITLKDAVFQMQYWENGSWHALSLDGQSTFTTNDDGQIILSMIKISDEDAKQGKVDPLENKIVCIEETAAPDGYARSNQKYYAYFTKSDKTFERALDDYILKTAFIQALGLDSSASAQDIMRRVSYVNKAVNLMVPNKNIRVEVKKFWVDYAGRELERKPSSAQVQLRKSDKVLRDNVDLVVHVQDIKENGLVETLTKTYQNIEVGSEAILTFKGYYDTVFHYEYGSQEGTFQVKDNDRGTSIAIDVTSNVSDIRIYPERGYQDLVHAYVEDKCRFEEAGYTVSGEGELVEEVELNAGNNWYYSWDELEADDKLFYIKEVGLEGSVYEVSYDNNGISSGLIVVTNKDTRKPEDKPEPVPALPSTGGSGTTIFTIAGASLMALAAVILILLSKKRHPDK